MAKGRGGTMADAAVALTTAGPVRGTTEAGVYVFKGVRYGRDTATTRFAAPEPPEPWTDVRDAMGYARSAPQAPPADVPLFRSWRPHPPLPTSEDCLFLNVWTPALRDGKRRPVMVWAARRRLRERVRFKLRVRRRPSRPARRRGRRDRES